MPYIERPMNGTPDFSHMFLKKAKPSDFCSTEEMSSWRKVVLCT
jgi:hypothetical protein